MTDVLPECMMPDGADPCTGYHTLRARLTAVEKERDELREALTEIAEYPLPDELNCVMGEGAAEAIDWRQRAYKMIMIARAVCENR